MMSDDAMGDDVETVTIDEDQEYSVEDIVDRRRNSKTGNLEYLIKWENYPEDQNTWEPIENLKCPELIAKFNDQAKAKRRRALSQAASARKPTPSKRPRKARLSDSTANTAGAAELARLNASAAAPAPEPLLVEDDVSDTETQSSSFSGVDRNNTEQLTVESRLQPTGFDRGLSIERIVGSCTDDEEKLWFFIKWESLNELELVESNELEEKAPRELCCWYRERLYYALKNPSDLELCSQVKA